jgi:WD40 repeat protein
MPNNATRTWRGTSRLVWLAVVALLVCPSWAADQKQAVYCVRFSPDSKRLVSGGASRKVQVWDLEKATEIASFDHPAWVQTVDFSDDGKYVLSGSRGCNLRIWDIAANKMHKEFAHQGWVVTGRFLPDTKSVLSLGGDDQKSGKAGIRLWDLESGAEQRAFNLAEKTEIKIAPLGFGSLSQDGKTLAIGGGPLITIWDVEKGEPLRTLTGLKGVWKLAISPDGKRCLAGGDKELCVWNASDGKLLKSLARPVAVRAVAFSADGKLFADGGMNGQVTIWDAEKFTKVRDIPAHQYICESIEFSPNGMLLATGSFDNTIKVWNLKTGQQLRILDGQPHSPLPPLPAGPEPKPPATSRPAA